MLVFVAGDAAGRKAKVSSGRIFYLDRGAFLGRDVRRVVTLITSQAGVLAFEQVAGLLVIEGLEVPLDQRKVFAIVLGVAAGAFLTGTGWNVIGGVKTFAGSETGRDLGMTVETLQCCLAAELVATGAVGGSVQGLVRARQWSRRNLRSGSRE